MSAHTIRDLFIDELNDMLDAETKLTKALPELANAANSEELSTAFQEHLEQTEGHIQRLHRVFEKLDETPKPKPCKAMAGLIAEGQELMHEDGSPDVRDEALIAAAQKVEHYEIATYGCLRTWAELLEEPEAAELLQETLDEEGETDKRLTRIAESIDPRVKANGDDAEVTSVKRRSAAHGTTPKRTAKSGAASRRRS